jgi:hypothetical protein
MYAFSLLQNSSDLKMFVEYFKDIRTIFGSQFKSEDNNSAFTRIRQAIKIRPADQDEFELIYSSSLKAIEEAEVSCVDLEKDYDEDEVKKAKETFKAKSKFYLKCLEVRNDIINKIKELILMLIMVGWRTKLEKRRDK